MPTPLMLYTVQPIVIMMLIGSVVYRMADVGHAPGRVIPVVQRLRQLALRVQTEVDLHGPAG